MKRKQWIPAISYLGTQTFTVANTQIHRTVICSPLSSSLRYMPPSLNNTSVSSLSKLKNQEENSKQSGISTICKYEIVPWLLVLKPISVAETITESYSDDDEEDLKDYRVGGYHPVEVSIIVFA